jgi:hypothetical protein
MTAATAIVLALAGMWFLQRWSERPFTASGLALFAAFCFAVAAVLVGIGAHIITRRSSRFRASDEK